MVRRSQSENTASRTSRATYALVLIGIFTVIGQLPNAFNELFLTYAKEHDKELFNKLVMVQFQEYADAVEVWTMTPAARDVPSLQTQFFEIILL